MSTSNVSDWSEESPATNTAPVEDDGYTTDSSTERDSETTSLLPHDGADGAGASGRGRGGGPRVSRVCYMSITLVWGNVSKKHVFFALFGSRN